jgi:adenylate kinase family enzyme
LSFPVKLAVVGHPFSGKTTLAQQVSSEQGLALIDPVALVTAAVAAADDFVPPPPADPQTAAEGGGGDGSSAFLSPTRPSVEGGFNATSDEADDRLPLPLEQEELPPRKIVLGRLAKAALQDAAPVPDEVLVGLVVEAIVALRDSPDEPADGGAAKAGGKDGKAKGKDGKAAGTGVEEVPGQATLPGPRGFMLDGFPRTAAQAKLLEKALVGLDLEWREALKQKASQVSRARCFAVRENLRGKFPTGVQKAVGIYPQSCQTTKASAEKLCGQTRAHRAYHEREGGCSHCRAAGVLVRDGMDYRAAEEEASWGQTEIYHISSGSRLAVRAALLSAIGAEQGGILPRWHRRESLLVR